MYPCEDINILWDVQKNWRDVSVPSIREFTGPQVIQNPLQERDVFLQTSVMLGSKSTERPLSFRLLPEGMAVPMLNYVSCFFPARLSRLFQLSYCLC